MPVRVLLTGFEPFGDHAINPSERVLRPLAAAAPGGAVVSTRLLRVSYRDAFAPVREALDNERFDAVLHLGLGAGRAALSFERVAVNHRGGALPDNDGVRIVEERIEPGGPTACFSTLPVDRLIRAVLTAGVPAEESEDAGTFLCNQVLYQTLRHCDRHAIRARAGFVHLPLLPGMDDDERPSLAEPLIVGGLIAAIAELATLPPPEPITTEE